MSLTFEQYNELLSKITDKGTFEYISLLLPFLITLATLYWSHQTFNKQAKLLKEQKLFTNDVEKIYEALDLLFNYFNASNLFFSLNGKEFDKAIKGSDLEVEKGKTDASSEAFYQAISDFKRASFLMKALGQKDISQKLDDYHNSNIVLRKEVLKNKAFLAESKNFDSIKDLMSGTESTNSYSSRVFDLEIRFNLCVDDIVTYKKSLK